MNRAIVTLIIGEEGKMLSQYSLPRLNDYAKKVNARMIVIRQRLPNFDFIPMAKFYMQRHLQNYSEGLFFVDADTLINRNTPDIFEMMPKTGVSVVMDSVDEKYDKPRWRKYVRAAAALTETTEWESYFNSGVMLIRKDCDKLFMNPEYRNIMPWFPEQTILNLNCHRFNIPIHFLDKKWNLNTLNGGNENSWQNCYIAHFSGLDLNSRLYLMNTLNQILP